MTYGYLVMAIVSEVVATSALNASDGFTRPLPSLVTVIGYGLAFYFLALTLRTMPMGIAYALWSGIGIVLITLVGAVFFKQVPDAAAVLGMLLIVAGVILVSAVSRTSGH